MILSMSFWCKAWKRSEGPDSRRMEVILKEASFWNRGLRGI